jgi:hypothetical protein
VTPKIIFQRAPAIYDRHLNPLYPLTLTKAERLISSRIQKLEKRWKNSGPRVVKLLNKTTGLRWIDQDIRCYVTPAVNTSFSHPMTLRPYPSADDMFEVFTHELIHRLLNNSAHPPWYIKSRNAFLESFQNESLVTQRHIILHALHSLILRRLFGTARLKRALAFSKQPEYVRSWKIVDELGYIAILKAVFPSKGRKRSRPKLLRRR